MLAAHDARLPCRDMSFSIWLRLAGVPVALGCLTYCSGAPPSSCDDGASCANSAGSGNPATGGAFSASGAASEGGLSASSGANAAAGSAGSAGAGGAASSSAGAALTGGTGQGVAGASLGGGGSAGASGGSAGGSSAGGVAGSSAGGTNAAGSSAGGTGPVVDQNGQALAKPGDSKTMSREYLNLGDFRVLNNKWGSDELGCGTTMKVFANTDKSFGWSFDRGACGGNKQKPDYPEVEFGIHPFGANSPLATSPSFPSTTLLPLQIKSITSASIVVDGLNAAIQKASTWNVDFEFWLSQKNPLTDTANPGVYAEVIVFWGWKDDWACDKSGSVTAGDKTYSLCHQDDQWANGQWRYFQFRANGGPYLSYSGKADVKAFLSWLVSTQGYSADLWLTRLEVGSELDDNTAGSVTMKNVTFEINGVSKSAQFGQ